MSDVSIALTSCDRIDLLRITLWTFFRKNTYPIEEVIIRDDSGLKEIHDQTELTMKLLCPFKYKLLPRGQVGQLESIKLLMAEVKTPFVFHMEDDWEFTRGGFIEECLGEAKDDISQVRVRDRGDGSATVTVPHSELSDLCTNHLFSFNPHLRKTYMPEGNNETEMGEWVKSQGLKTLWLKNGACIHIGDNKTTNRAGTPYQSGVKKA